MKDIGVQQKLKWWPSLQDYNEAIQSPQLNLQDLDLKNGTPYTTPMGLPRAVTGAFASVYRMHCSEKDYALRFFLRNIQNQSQRYALITDFLQHGSLPWTATFQFLDSGVKSRGEWFPALKMDWIDGQPFEEYLIDNLEDEHKLIRIINNFVEMMEGFRSSGTAHGDLQHGNIIVCGDELRLVDYDGMFVPAMQNFMANEIGHPNYQHPKRSEFHFGPYIDNFSAWVIYSSLKGLQHDPALLNQLGGADDCLLFRKTDFLEPLQSPAFAAFEKHQNVELRMLGRYLRSLLEKEVQAIPYLEPSLAVNFNDRLTEISADVSGIKSGPRLQRSDPSDWLDSDNLGVLNVRATQNDSIYRPASEQKSWVVQSISAPAAVWVKPVPVTAQQYTLPEELRPGADRKTLKFMGLQGVSRPEQVQWFMLANPLVWIMCYYLFIACTTDESFRQNAGSYDATVIRVLHFDTHNKDETIPHTDVEARYVVNGKAYFISNDFGSDKLRFKQGDVYPVYALPTDPSITAPFGSGSGSRQVTDLLWAGMWALFNLMAEAIIWTRPLMHKRLARYGIPVIVLIKDMYITTTGTTSSYFVNVQYVCKSQTIKQKMNLTEREFESLRKDTAEIGLVDPAAPTYLLLYKFSLYKPVAAP